MLDRAVCAVGWVVGSWHAPRIRWFGHHQFGVSRVLRPGGRVTNSCHQSLAAGSNLVGGHHQVTVSTTTFGSTACKLALVENAYKHTHDRPHDPGCCPKCTYALPGPYMHEVIDGHTSILGCGIKSRTHTKAQCLRAPPRTHPAACVHACAHAPTCCARLATRAPSMVKPRMGATSRRLSEGGWAARGGSQGVDRRSLTGGLQAAESTSCTPDGARGGMHNLCVSGVGWGWGVVARGGG